MALDLKLNPPKNKKDLKKDEMLLYVKKYGSRDDKVWFVELLNNNKVVVENQLPDHKGEEVNTYDWKVVREAFAQRFFEKISDKYKRESKVKKTKPSFVDELEKLLEE